MNLLKRIFAPQPGRIASVISFLQKALIPWKDGKNRQLYGIHYRFGNEFLRKLELHNRCPVLVDKFLSASAPGVLRQTQEPVA